MNTITDHVEAFRLAWREFVLLFARSLGMVALARWIAKVLK